MTRGPEPAREELLDAVRRTADGHAVFTPGLAAMVLGEFRRLAATPAAPEVELVRYATEHGLAK